MAVAVFLPKLGMTMEEGVLTRWVAADGVSVRAGESLFELETEKVATEVEAERDGMLRHLAPEGATLPPGAIVGCLLFDGETEVPPDMLEQAAGQPTSLTAGAEPRVPVADPGAVPAATAGGRVLASPVARRLAIELGVDLSRLAGSGPGGRIVEQDVRAAADGRGPALTSTAGAPAEDSPHTIPYEGRRRVIGERMHQSLQSMAQLTLTATADVEAAADMVHGLNREWRSDRVVVTLTALVVRACSLALREHPRLNARLEDGSIVLEMAAQIGFAVDHEDGLMVPVVRGAGERSLKEVATAIAALTDRVKDGTLEVDDVSGGTFTVSSLEGSSVDSFTPIVNPPQAAILGVGRVRDLPVFEDGAVRRGRATTLSLSFDHRVVDGWPAARFLDRVVQLLARPYLLM
jgi:pyruvate dehydrogenase E2 component (dihydrolipoamide acetyltransferase)